MDGSCVTMLVQVTRETQGGAFRLSRLQSSENLRLIISGSSQGEYSHEGALSVRWMYVASSVCVWDLRNGASVVGLILHFFNSRRPSSDRSFGVIEVVLNRKPFHRDRERMRTVVSILDAGSVFSLLLASPTTEWVVCRLGVVVVLACCPTPCGNVRR
jgi:hypothetical protein